MPKPTKEQEKAINYDGTNILVSAGAGSGKTTVLSDRVLRKVKSGINIDEILILTFTDAASISMANKIREKLIKSNLLDQVIRMDKAYITTFDSFALGILKKYHDRLNLSKNVSIIDANSINLYKIKILDQIFMKRYEDGHDDFIKLIEDFCLKDDKELKSLILKISNKLDLKYNKKEYLNTYLDKYYSDGFINNKLLEYIDILKEEIDKIKLNLDVLSNGLDSSVMESFYDVLNPLISSTTYDEIRSNSAISLPKLPNNSGMTDVKSKIKASVDNIINLTNFDEDYIKENYLSTKVYLKEIISIILELDDIVDKYKYEHNTFDFIDVSKLVINLVEKNDDVRLELSNSFKEIMIDEYQDTSDLQEEFIKLISNNNTYMVGDIKQSIYRFRNANPDIFKEKYLKYSNNDNGIKIDLKDNFRSREEVVEGINTIFDEVMDLSYGGADYKNTHRMIFGNKSYNTLGNTLENYDLNILNYNIEKGFKYNKNEIEAFIIASDIKSKIDNKYKIYDKDNDVVRTVNYGDFSILIDRATYFNLYKKIFEYFKIPLTIEKKENISTREEVSILKNILKLIDCISNQIFDNTFKYSFISISRSYLFRYNDDYIYDIVTNNKYEDTELYKMIEDITLELGKLDLPSLLIMIKEKFDFDKKVITAGDVNLRISTFEYFINLVNNLKELDYSLNDFINYLDMIIETKAKIEIPVSVNDLNSCKLMTIHNSKGLEYHICYYPGISNEFNLRELNDKVLIDNTYGIVVPSFKDFYQDTFLRELVKRKYMQEEISEKIRLLYVSLTRAKEKMILITNINLDEDKEIDKSKYKSFLNIIESIVSKLSNYIESVDINKLGLTKDYKKDDISKSISKYDVDKLIVNEYSYEKEIIDEKHFSKVVNKLIDKKTNNNMLFGRRIHEILEFIDLKNPNIDNLDITNKEKEYVNNFLKQDILKNVNNANILKEYEFYYTNDNYDLHGIIDLMLEYGDYIDIIDYKLKDIDDSHYLEQLNGYKEYIENKTNKKVNIYLYSIINNNLKKYN